MKAAGFRSRAVTAVVAASVAAAVLAFLIVLALGQLSAPRRDENWIELIPVVAAIVLFWAPAAAAIPASILAVLVEWPMARAAIRRRDGGVVPFVLLSVAAGALLSFVPALMRNIFHPDAPLYDPFTLAIFSLIGLCSGVAWWFMVVEPGRRE